MTAPSWSRVGIVVVVGIVFQVSVLNNIVLLGAHADLMVVIAAAGGIVAGPGRGAMIGFVAGCFSDLSVSLPFGFGPLAFTLVGFGSGYLLRAVSGRDIPVAELLTTAVASMGGTVLYALLASGLGQPGMVGITLLYAVLLVAAGALIFGHLVLRVVSWIIEPSATPIGGIGAG